jgi:hypothetical protein
MMQRPSISGKFGDDPDDDDIEYEVSQLKTFFLNAIRLYDFIEDPSGSIGWTYHSLLVAFNFVYMIIILLETADGPNYYRGHRPNESLYPQLPDYNQYLILKLFFSIPLLIHCVLRLVLATILHHFSSPFTHRTFTHFFSKSSNLLLCLWFWPLIIVSIKPGLWPMDYMAFYHIIDFLRHLQILQTFKEVPSFLVVKETYRRVMRLVPIPIFLFFVFNIFIGLLIYLVDPCYNADTCPFETLFDAVFFSIVTMTTSKYPAALMIGFRSVYSVT